MGKPDALSRRADHGTGSQDNQDITLLPPSLFTIRALEGVSINGEEQLILRDIHKGNNSEEQEESVAKAARELKHSSTRTVQSAEWSEVDGLLMFRGKIYVPTGSDLQRHIVSLCHDSRIAGHAGRWKTLELVSRNYWWPQMSRYIGQYMSTCNMCLCTKPQQ